MHVFTKRNALAGWIVTRVARRRLERRLNEIAGNRRARLWLPLGALLAVVATVAAAGAVVVRRA